ncbi:MAG: hypothetical protein WA110_02025 [Anaerolineaceae bacterium]
MPDEMIICPHCGEENLPQATRCVHCGLDLEQLFTIEGIGETLAGMPDFLDDDQDSLPEVLRELRREEERMNAPEEPAAPPSRMEENRQDGNPSALSENQDAQDAEDKEDVPEWLERIRQRAQEEMDSSGEFVKKINTVDEIREADAQSQVDGEFVAWIARIRERTRRENMQNARQVEEPPEEEGVVPEWLQRVRDLQPKPEDEITQELPTEETLADENSDLQYWQSEWQDRDLTDEELEALKAQLEGKKEPTEPVEVSPVQRLPGAQEIAEPVPDLAPETNLPTDGQTSITMDAAPALPAEEEALSSPFETEPSQAAPEEETPQELPAEPILEGMGMGLGPLDLPEEPDDEPTPTGDVTPDLLLLRSQRERAELLRNLVGEEGRPLSLLKTQKPSKSGWARFVLAMLLLVALVATVIIAPPLPPSEAINPAPALAFQDALGKLSPGDQVLVVVDYQTATSVELEQLAVPVIQYLEEKKVIWTPLTTHPNGIWLSQQLFDHASIADPPEVIYLPGAKLGLLTLVLEDQPAGYSPLLSGESESLKDFTNILLLEDSGSDVQSWMEQVGPWLDGGEFLVLSSHQEAATLLPYYDSGQISGYLAGVGDARILQDELKQPDEDATPFRAYQVGLLVMVAVLLLGMISKAEKDSDSQHQKDRKP